MIRKAMIPARKIDRADTRKTGETMASLAICDFLDENGTAVCRNTLA